MREQENILPEERYEDNIYVYVDEDDGVPADGVDGSTHDTNNSDDSYSIDDSYESESNDAVTTGIDSSDGHEMQTSLLEYAGYDTLENAEEYAIGPDNEAGSSVDYTKLDNSGPNYSQAEVPIENEDIKLKEDKKVSSFLLMIKVLLNPIEGWKSVRRARLSVERAQSGCFYPLLAVLAVCEFADFFYSSRITLETVIIRSLIAFVSFFFGYFCIMILLKLLMPKSVKGTVTSEFGKVFVIISLSSLCLFYSAVELLPMLWALLIFLPLWTIYIICRGARFFRFPYSKQIRCTGLLCLLIIGIPLIIDQFLMEILH